MSLYLGARFAECIEACRHMQAGGDAAKTEFLLLMTRAMLRLNRPELADEALRAVTSGGVSGEAAVTAAMLHAIVRLEFGHADEALALLHAADEIARGAHSSVRAELEVARGRAYFSKRDFAAALRHVYQVHADAGVVHAQALELQARCYDELGKKRDAATSFVAALVRLDACSHPDLGVIASSIAGLSQMALELTDAGLVQAVESRYALVDWPPDLWAQRCTIEMNIARQAVFRGDLAYAVDFALRSLASAASDRMRLSAYATLAHGARHAGDSSTARTCMEAVWRILRDRDGRETDAKPVSPEALLDVIEETAVYDMGRARAMFDRRARDRKQAGEAEAESDTRRGRERYVDGLICQAERRVPSARACFADAYALFRRTDSSLYAIESAYGLAALGDDAMYWYVCGALAGMTNWMTAGLKRVSSSAGPAAGLVDERRASFAKLTPSQREVVQLVCAGHSNPDIAKLRKTTVQTVKNLLTSQIYPAFGVANRGELRAALSEVIEPMHQPETIVALRSAQS